MHQIRGLKWLSSRHAVVSAHYIEARCSVENEDVVGAAPTGDAPTTSEWWTIVLPTKVQLILEVWQYYFYHWYTHFYSVVEEAPAKNCRYWCPISAEQGPFINMD